MQEALSHPDPILGWLLTSDWVCRSVTTQLPDLSETKSEVSVILRASQHQESGSSPGMVPLLGFTFPVLCTHPLAGVL